MNADGIIYETCQMITSSSPFIYKAATIDKCNGIKEIYLTYQYDQLFYNIYINFKASFVDPKKIKLLTCHVINPWTGKIKSSDVINYGKFTTYEPITCYL